MNTLCSYCFLLKEGEAAQRLSGAAVQLGVNVEEEVTKEKESKMTAAGV